MEKKKGIISTKTVDSDYIDFYVFNKTEEGYLRRFKRKDGHYDFYFLTMNLCDRLGGMNLISSRHIQPQSLGVTKDLKSCIEECEGNKYFISRINDKHLLDAGIKVIPYSDKGFYYSALTELEKDLKKHNIEYSIKYTIPKQNIIISDETNRSIADTVYEGYRGNRLDLMVGTYFVMLYTPSEAPRIIAQRVNGQFTEKPPFQEVIDRHIVGVYVDYRMSDEFLDIIMKEK